MRHQQTHVKLNVV